MPLRIAFDVDGVFADMESELVRQAELLFGRGARPRDQQRGSLPLPHARSPADDEPISGAKSENIHPRVRRRLKTREQRRLWRHVALIPSFWESLKEIEPGATAALASVAAARRWEVMFLTKRPDSVGPSVQLQTQRWLESHGYALPSVFVVQGSRGRVAAALGLDFVVDDRPENCVDVLADSKARPILVWREDTECVAAGARRLEICIVKSTTACIATLAEIDASIHQDAGAFDRVIQLLGLKSALGLNR